MKLKTVLPTVGGPSIWATIAEIATETLPWLTDLKSYLDIEYVANYSGNKTVSPIIDYFIEQNTAEANPEKLTEAQLMTLAHIIYNRNLLKWERLYNLTQLEYNPIQNYDMSESETPNITRTETPNITRTETPNIERATNKSTSVDISETGTSNNADDIYAFNSAEPTPANESSGNSTKRTKADATENNETSTETETGTRTETEQGTRTETETGTRTLTRSGNIGVTTSQQMIESEISLYNKFKFIATLYFGADEILTSSIYTD